ncbi:hypothetical protein V6N11_022635 [Hibiscus sabdariffa]|uniref:Uncharacterized protein n=1 Tax=Hibiscus sabdariffa TaxID=183260 RepID=A0ABR2TKM9_9ROSI
MHKITFFLLAWLAGTSKWKGNTKVERLSTEAELEEEREQLTVQEGGYCSGSYGWWPIHLPWRVSVLAVADQVGILVAHVG